MSILAAERMSRQQIEPSGGNITLRLPDINTLTSCTFSVLQEGVILQSGVASISAVEGGYILTSNVSSLPIGSSYKLNFTPDLGPSRQVLFDVVKQPYGPLITLEDILAEKPDLKRTIEQMAGLLDVTSDQFVEVVADSARCVLDDLLKDRLQSVENINRVDVKGNPTSHVYLRGYMITDINLRRIERYLAVAEIFSRKSKGESEEDEDNVLYRFFFSRAKAALAASGQIRIDIDQDGKSDGTTSLSSTITITRGI